MITPHHINTTLRMIKRTLHALSLPTLILGASLQFAACKDNELDGNNNPNPSEQQINEQWQRHQSLLSLLSMTADLDSLPTGWEADTYTAEPTLGEPLDASQPYVRTVPTTSAEEADRIYRSMTGQNVDGTAKSSTWTQEGIGSLSLKVLNQQDLYATIDVSVKQLPHLTQLRFVPASAVGTNLAPKDDPYYHVGDVILQTKPGETPTYWVCVRPCSKAASVRKSHWCSFQLNPLDKTNPNYVSLHDGNLIIPTRLSFNKSESERMVQNFFNVLRCMAKPEYYNKTGARAIGEITQSSGELSYDDVRNMSNLWNEYDIWDRLKTSNNMTELYTQLQSEQAPEINALYYGYEKKLWRNAYQLFNLRLRSGSQGGLYNIAQKETPTIDNSARNFTALETGKADFNFDDNSKGLSNQFIVKHRTGAQLEDNMFVTIDNNPGYSFDAEYNEDADESNYITDIATRQMLNKKAYQNGNAGFFVVGDLVTLTSTFTGSQVCLRERSKHYRTAIAEEDTMAVFVSSNEGKIKEEGLSTGQIKELEQGYAVSDQMAKHICFHLLNAFAYERNGVNLAQPSKFLSWLSDDFYQQGMKNIYNVCNGHPAIQYASKEGNTYTLTVNFFTGENCLENNEVKKPTQFQMQCNIDTENETSTWTFTKLGQINAATHLRVNTYNDQYTYRETYSTERQMLQPRKYRSASKDLFYRWIETSLKEDWSKK